MRKAIKIIVLIFLISFGGLTVFLTSSVLLDLFGIRQKEGNFVPFIVWINLFSGFGYLLAAYGIWKNKNRTTILLVLNIILLIIGNIALYFHIQAGGIYKMETVKGMIFRLVVTTVVVILTKYFIINKSLQNEIK